MFDVKRRLTQKLMNSAADGSGFGADDSDHVMARKTDIENLKQMLTRLATAIKK